MGNLLNAEFAFTIRKYVFVNVVKALKLKQTILL